MALVEFDGPRRSSMDKSLQMSAELRIVLFSSRRPLQTIVSNCILGRQVIMPAEGNFSQISKNHEEIEGRKVSVINTGNFFEKDHTQQHIEKELKRCVCLSCPGPHAVLLILDLEDISATDVRTVEKLTKYFVDNILKYTILVLCHDGKEENPNLEDRLWEGINLREILDKCGHRYHLFNKNSVGAKPLLKRIESLVAENGDRFFTNDKYEEIEGSIRKVETFVEKESEKEMDKRLCELDCMYQGEELKRERDQYLKIVRAEIRKEAEQIILYQLKFPAQDTDYGAGMHAAFVGGLGATTMMMMMRGLGGGVTGSVLGMIGAAIVVAVVVWRFWRR
uniref:Si:dkey-120c6.5 n=2 Tax=Paramormyrops kingsleyae TaxID=1676925 RepID=A0A3B3SRB5_9TELE|nr:GTPase IMAP family member 4-like [Paramormyrops kingsleyae]